MALTRRNFILAVPMLAGVFVACSGSQSGNARMPYTELGVTKAPSADAKTIVAFMPQTQQTEDVWLGLSDELARDFRLVAVRLDTAADVAIIEQAIARHNPVGLVLMNNPTVAAYREFQRRHAGNEFPPSVIVMTSFLEDPSSQLVNATGISYEVPLVMLMTDLRKLIALPAERVGVVVRSPLRRFIKRQVELARREKVVVAVEEVSPSPKPAELRLAIRRLKRRVDVIWILNDDQLLSSKLITKGWLPGLNERPWVPTIVGAASLVSPGRSFGTFAVLPDHVALGAQAANLLLDLADAEWRVEPGRSVQLSRSNKTVVDLTQIRERFTLRQDALRQIDSILE